MRLMLAAVGVMLLASPTLAAETKPVVVTPVIATSVTSSGQPIVLPQHDAQVVVSTYDIAAGAVLPEHKHPFPRYGYVLTGTLRVTNADTGKSDVYKPGDFILESVGQWHKADTVGDEPVKLLVIDMIEKDRPNTVIRK
jgi:quercetin dioxygenase-like cupin family protein